MGFRNVEEEFSYLMDEFARAAITKDLRLGGSRDRNVSLYGSGGQTSEVKVGQGWCLPKAVKDGCGPGLSPSFWLATIFGVL